MVLNNSDYKFFQKARRIAEISDYPKIHVGCVAVYQNQVIAIGCNSNKTHPLQKRYNRYRDECDSLLPKLHAEIHCINQLRHLNVNYTKVKLYIYRISNDKPFRMCRPCPSCMAAIKDLGIRDVYYTTNDGFVHERIENNEVREVA